VWLAGIHREIHINLQSRLRHHQLHHYNPSPLLSLSIGSTLSPLTIINMARTKQTARRATPGKALRIAELYRSKQGGGKAVGGKDARGKAVGGKQPRFDPPR